LNKKPDLFIKDNGEVDRNQIYILELDEKDIKYNNLVGSYGLSEIEFKNSIYKDGGFVLVKRDNIFDVFDSHIYIEVSLCGDSTVFITFKNGVPILLTNKICYGVMYRLSLDTIKYFEDLGNNLLGNKNSLIFRCIEKEDIKSLKYLYDKRNNKAVKNNSDIDIDLWYAIKEDKLRVIKFLIENITDLNLDYPLRYAINFKNYRLGLYFVMHGADIKNLSFRDRLKLKVLKKVYQFGSKIWKYGII